MIGVDVGKYCCESYESIESYDRAIADTTQIWHYHPNTTDGERRPVDLTMQELIALDMYYGRPTHFYDIIRTSPFWHCHHRLETHNSDIEGAPVRERSVNL